MSPTKIILISVLLSTVFSVLIATVVVTSLKNANPSQTVAETPVTIPDETAPNGAVQVVPETPRTPLEIEFDNLVKRNQEVAEEMEQYEFSDPKHAALLQELNELGKKIEENIVERKRNQVIAP